jgi:hypothetical protein
MSFCPTEIAAQLPCPKSILPSPHLVPRAAEGVKPSRNSMSFMEQKENQRAGRKLAGRPALVSGKRSFKIDVRFTEDEYQQMLALEKALGIRKAEIVRMRVLKDVDVIMINALELIKRLDLIGAELGKSGSNINQLAKYANTLQKRGLLSVQVVERFNLLFEQYLRNQEVMELTLRKVLRAMSK